ncbi:uncharacterized protein TNCV_1709941 [Trichonephila clavipes]|nr:uncharacterized protein TNCV_1709941 [Trichonephila clavipes]
MAAFVSEYTLEFFMLLNARGKKELIEWCMKEGLIASSYECPKCNKRMGLYERKSVVLDGFEWRYRKKVVNDSVKIGVNVIVEIDEIKFGKMKYGKGKPVNGKWVLGATGLLVLDHVILNHGQVTWMTPELAPPSPNFHTTPTGGRFSSTDIMCITALHDGSLVVQGSNS